MAVDRTGKPSKEASTMVDLATCKRWVEDYLDATEEHRRRAEVRRDYRVGKQWTDEEQRALQDRGQPIVTFNVFGEKVSTMVGAEVVGDTVPHAVGRNMGADQATAAVATAAMRYVTDEADWANERILGREQLFVEGVVATEIHVERPDMMAAQVYEDGQLVAEAYGQDGNPEIQIKHIPYERVFWDPKSMFADFRDAKYLGTIVWLDLDEAVETYPGKRDMLELSVAQNHEASETFDDKPRHWVEGGANRPRVRIATCWYREGRDWYVATHTGSGYLDEPRRSPYVDDRGRTIPGIVLGSAIVEREENERIGPAQDLISPQDELNKRRSKALFLMNSWNVVADEGAFQDERKAVADLHRGYGVVFKRPGAQVTLLDRQAQIVDNMQLMQDARNAFETLGPSAALSGTVGESASGVAIQQRQASAMLKFGDYLRAAKKWELSVYRHVWFRIRQYWTAQDWIRVTEDQDAENYLEVNKPITMADVLVQRGVDPAMLQAANQSGLLEAQGIDLTEVVGQVNHLQRLDIDVLIRDKPASNAYRHDQIAALADMLGKLRLPEQATAAATEMLLEMVDIDPRVKERLLKAMQPDPMQQQMAMQAQAQQQALAQQLSSLQMAKLEADVAKTQAEVAKLQAETETETTEAVENTANANRLMADAAQKQSELFQPRTQLLPTDT